MDSYVFLTKKKLSDRYFDLIKKGEIAIHRGPDNQKFIEIKIFLPILNDYQ